MAAVVDYMIRPKRFLAALVALLVMQAIIVAGVPERVATAGGYRGSLKIFRFDQAMFQTPDYASDLKADGEQGSQQGVRGHVLWHIATPLLYALALAWPLSFLPPLPRPPAPPFQFPT